MYKHTAKYMMPANTYSTWHDALIALYSIYKGYIDSGEMDTYRSGIMIEGQLYIATRAGVFEFSNAFVTDGGNAIINSINLYSGTYIGSKIRQSVQVIEDASSSRQTSNIFLLKL